MCLEATTNSKQRGKRYVTFNLIILLAVCLFSCQSVKVGSVVEASKYERPRWAQKSALTVDGSVLNCITQFEAEDDLPKSIKDAQIDAKKKCDSQVARYYLSKSKGLSKRYTERDIEKRLQNCSKKCSEINDMYYEKVAETGNLYSFDIYVNMSYPVSFKIYH